MTIDKLHFNTTGFLSDASYSFHLHNILCKYKDSFGNAESLTLNLEEVPPGLPSGYNKKQIDFSEDGKSVIINLISQKFTDQKNKIIRTPSPATVFKTIHFVLGTAVKKYKEQFSKE
jgi:hypothetical protein